MKEEDPLERIEWRVQRLVAGPADQKWLVNEVKALREQNAALLAQIVILKADVST